MKIRRGGAILVTSLAAALCACTSADDEAYEMAFRDSGGVVAPPGRPGGSGGWLGNGLEDPDVSGVDPAYPLDSAEGMSESLGLLTDPALRGTAEYLVECALPLGESITKLVDGQTLVFEGLLGLAPEWADDECDEDCQQWVTACLLARTNVSGQDVTVWIQADHSAIGYGTAGDLVHEASWYGNLFTGDDDLYLCKGDPGAGAKAKHEGRTCSTGDNCGFTKFKKCKKHNRCTMAGPDGKVPMDCKAHGNDTWHTISTYLPDD